MALLGTLPTVLFLLWSNYSCPLQALALPLTLGSTSAPTEVGYEWGNAGWVKVRDMGQGPGYPWWVL
jgi:hypothetical protein